MGTHRDVRDTQGREGHRTRDNGDMRGHEKMGIHRDTGGHRVTQDMG